jgi:hypothetical protein
MISRLKTISILFIPVLVLLLSFVFVSSSAVKAADVVVDPGAIERLSEQIGLTEAEITAILESGKEDVLTQLLVDSLKAERELADKLEKNALAGAWKAMLSQFTEQLAYDTASWIASGGKGQKPLFVTEGWGTYLKNAADNSVGTFIDEIDDQFGVNLCNPDFNVTVAIKSSLGHPNAPRQASCSFTRLANNWRTAISDASFSFEYNNYLRSSENDIGIYLTTKSQLMDKVKEESGISALELLANQGFKNVENLTGWILTPGTMIRNQHETANFWANRQDSEFTGTVWDFIGTFLDTLVGKLLQNLQSGFFSDGSGSNSGGLNLPNLNRFASLLNPDSSPYVEGSIGSKERFLNLIEGEISVGGPYDILSQLLLCSDAAKINPKPTDCVIDQTFAQSIRDKRLLKDLPESILNRRFAPSVDEITNPQEVFTMRNVMILRKYRIVPVGWEIAARYINEFSEDGDYFTLRDLMSQFNQDGAVFESLVDPLWVLKAPEVFCRRDGYGAHNTQASAQDDSIRHSRYCADEQQCIREDSDGNCIAYGYCTEEKKIWNFEAEKCEPRFNTCQTFQSRGGETGSYLANTLDYANCNSQNVGCRWYSNLFNPIDGVWMNSEDEEVLKVCQNPGGCTADGALVPQWDQVHMTTSRGTVMASACDQTGGCDFTAESCEVEFGGVQCSLDNCLGGFNIVTPLNSSFEVVGAAVWDAASWLEAYQDPNNRHFRSDESSRTGGYALQSISSANTLPLTTSLSGITADILPNEDYQLAFYLRGGISQGDVSVRLYSGDSEIGGYAIGNIDENWREYFVNFSTQSSDEIEIRIITSAGTIGQVFFDDFDLRRVDTTCQDSSVILTMGQNPNGVQEIYFDDDVVSCSSSAGGCSEFIRTQNGLGSNLLRNPGFEVGSGNQADLWNFVSDGGTGEVSRNAAISHSGNYSLKLESSGNNLWTAQSSYYLKAGNYVLSGWVFPTDVPNDDNTIRLDVRIPLSSVITFANKPASQWQKNTWQRISVPFTVDSDIGDVRIRAHISHTADSVGTAYFDDIQLERVLDATVAPSAYTDYDPSQRPGNQLAYLKQAPDYFGCYDSNLIAPGVQWPTTSAQLDITLNNRDIACSNYSGVCIPDEMNCSLYSPVNGDPSVPGTVSSADICPSECVGYAVYRQESTNFTSAKYEQFIADSSVAYCPASAAGCDEFTNLDEAERGGEAREYYTSLRTCQNPDAYTDEASYYTWEGSDITGYQLKVFTLKRSNDTSGTGVPPCTNIAYPNNNNGNNVCQDPVPSDNPATNPHACTADDLDSNPDCRELYDTNGNVHYRLLSKVIYVDNNCHPYRRTMTQDNFVEAAQDCRDSGGYFNSFNECIYMAIPGQGNTCSADLAGCREYTGNRGNSFKNILFTDFESGTAGWQGGTVAAEATHPGGNSLSNNTASSKLSRQVLIGNKKSYTLSFWAKGDGNIDLDAIRFSDAPAEDSFIIGSPTVVTDITVPIESEWKLYELGPIYVTWGDSDTGYFAQTLDFNIATGDTVYLDNILLKELPQSTFAIENSWFVPFACDNKLDTPFGTGDSLNPVRSDYGEMIGCQEYRDQSGQNWFLKSFETLCRADAVGCEELIKTYNSNSYAAQVFNDGDKSQVDVPADKLVYMVNAPQFECGSSEKGCTAYGLPDINNRDEVTGYSTVYLNNQPDRYDTDLCQADALWCEAFTGSRSISYFKNPRDRLCEYRSSADQSQPNWYKKGTDNELCDTSFLQTFGEGVASAKIQPIGWLNTYEIPSADVWFDASTGASVSYDNWVGSCSIDQNSCTEYIDPLTSIYKNLIRNADLSQNLDGNPAVPDYWQLDSGDLVQPINVKTHTLYSISSADPSSFVSLGSCGLGGIVSPDDSMNIIGAQEARLKTESGRFYIISNTDDGCVVNLHIAESAGTIENLSLTQTGTYYALSSQVDSGSCNGLVDYNSGCVLFNDRGVVDYSSSDIDQRNSGYLTFDAYQTYASQKADPNEQSQSPKVPSGGDPADSNIILNVSPDRACYSWLYCTTYEKDNPNDTDPILGNNDRCLDLGLCTSVDDSGSCNNFIVDNAFSASGDLPAVEEYNVDRDSNKSGYSFIGQTFPDGKSVSGYQPFGNMRQFGNAGVLTNGNFESLVVDSTEPIGWSTVDYPLGTTVASAEDIKQPIGWYDYKFNVVKDVSGSREGVRYLQVNSFYEALSEEIDVFPNTAYVISGWVNTSALAYPVSTSMESRIRFAQGQANSWGSWEDVSDLTVDAGLSWQRVTYQLTTGSNTVKLRVMLKNFVDSTISGENCNDYDKATPCSLGGFTLFDDVSIEPVLEVGDTGDVFTDRFVSRSCRIYPAGDSNSCRYLEGDNLFIGQYGYCLLSDPENPKQCLQWWPIDQLQGELISEVGGYSDRVPLDYCIEKDSFTVDFSEFGTAISLSSAAQEVVSGFFDADSGGSVNFTPIEINDDYRPLFRYPYVSKIKLNAYGVGLATTGSFAFMIPASVDLTYDLPAKEWNGWAAIPVCGDLGGVYVCVAVEVPWDLAIGPAGDILALATNYFNDNLGGTFGLGPLMGLRPVEDRQSSGLESGSVVDPIPDVDGDILGAAWFVKSVTETEVVAIAMTIGGEFDVNYCERFTRTVKSSGENKAYANRVSPGSGYVNTDSAARPDEAGNRAYYYYNPFDYNLFLDGLESVGPTDNPLEDSRYQSSDYQPFGALVAPVGSPSPENWTSREGLYHLPLFYEPPRLGGFDAPYQARMGELHTESGLKQLFAKSYGTWRWVWNKPGDEERGGYYLPLNTNTIQIPTSACTNPIRSESSVQPCYIPPQITDIKINDTVDAEIDGGVGLAQLGFTTLIDPDQLPLTGYQITWGDGENVKVNGISLRNRTNEENPFLLYHLYDFFKMQVAAVNGEPGLSCDDSTCTATVGVKVWDNWGNSVTENVEIIVNQ